MIGKHLVGWHLALALLIAFITIAPNFAYASQGGTTVTECWQNPNAEGCEDTTPPIEGEEEEKSSKVGLGIFDYLKMLFTLAFVLALLILVLKFLNKKSAGYQQNSVIRNIGGMTVGAQKSIQLLHIGNKLYIIGVGDDVQLIKEIVDPLEVQQLLDQYYEKQTTTGASPYIMDLLQKRKSPSKDGKKKLDTNTNFSEMLSKHLTDIQRSRRNGLEKWKEKEKGE